MLAVPGWPFLEVDSTDFAGDYGCCFGRLLLESGPPLAASEAGSLVWNVSDPSLGSGAGKRSKRPCALFVGRACST